VAWFTVQEDPLGYLPGVKGSPDHASQGPMSISGGFNSGDHNALPLDELESSIARIPSVTAARVVAASNGRIEEVHVLARRDRAPKQLVRDVQSVALASFGVEVDYRTISVVQLDDPLIEDDAHSSVPRVALTRLSAEVAGPSTEIDVQLNAGGQQLRGHLKGPASSSMRLVARAVVDAVSGLIADSSLDVDFADLVSGGTNSVAIAVLRLATAKGDQVVSGSAIVRRDGNDAMARATLSALNRLMAGT